MEIRYKVLRTYPKYKNVVGYEYRQSIGIYLFENDKYIADCGKVKNDYYYNDFDFLTNGKSITDNILPKWFIKKNKLGLSRLLNSIFSFYELEYLDTDLYPHINDNLSKKDDLYLSHSKEEYKKFAKFSQWGFYND